MAASLAVLRCQIRKTLLNINNLQEGKFAFYNSAVARDINVTNTAFNADGKIRETVEYPQIKQKYPPGKWSDMDPSYAWLWQKAIDDLWDITDVKTRQEYIVGNKTAHIDILPDHDHPNYFEFAKYATKTAIHPWSEFTATATANNKHLDESVIERMKENIIDQILIEQEAVERGDSHKMHSMFFKKRQAAFVLRSIFSTLATNLSGKVNYLKTCQYDENVIVRSVWDRFGIERKGKHWLDPDRELDDVSDHRILSSCIFDGMIRNHLPLPQVHPRTSGPSIESEKPELKYKCSSYGVSEIPDYELKSILAGHILGDPCEYGSVGFLLTNKLDNLDEKFGSKVAKRFRLGRSLTSTFTWLAAQAYNQGFSGFIDLTYPLVSQTVTSDGKNFSFMACQLNTLELWKPDSANDIMNLCWHTDEMPLYDCIENGQVKGFNDEVLRKLVDLFLFEPADRGYDMKPTISDKNTDSTGDKTNFIPEKMEDVMKKEEEQYIV